MNDRVAEISRLETPPPSWAIATAFVLIYLSWGTTYKATGFAMQDATMPPGLFGGIRLALAGAILLVCQAWRRQPIQLTRFNFLRVLPVCICLFPMGNYFVNVGQREVPSAVAAILIATTPLWIGLFGMAWPAGERLSVRGWVGLVVGFVGILLAMMPQVQDSFDFAKTSAALIVLASAASWGMGTLLSRHYPAQLPHLSSAGWQMLIGGSVQSLIGTLTGEWPELIAKFSLPALAAFTYLLFVGSLTGFIAFNWLLGHVSAAKVGTYAYVNPAVAVFVGWCWGETMNAWVFLGFAVILVGVYLVRDDHVPSKEIELEPD